MFYRMKILQIDQMMCRGECCYLLGPRRLIPDSMSHRYYPLEGNIFQAQTTWDLFTVFRMSWFGSLITHTLLWLVETLRLVPQGTWAVGETLKIAQRNLVRGGQEKVSCEPCFFPAVFLSSRFSSCVV
jgi:hypothetical protein